MDEEKARAVEKAFNNLVTELGFKPKPVEEGGNPAEHFYITAVEMSLGNWSFGGSFFKKEYDELSDKEARFLRMFFRLVKLSPVMKK